MRQTIDEIVVVRLDFHESLTHRSGVVAVLRRTGQTDRGRYGMLLDLQVIELELVVEGSTGIPDEVVLDYLRFGIAFTATGAAR